MLAASSERVRALAMKKSTSTLRLPSTATATRQPKLEVGPVAAMPSAISHLPSGGCTTNEPSGSSAAAMASPSPALNAAFAPSLQVPS